MAESSPPSTSWVGTWFEGNPPTQFFVDVNNDNGYFRADLFLIGKKKKKEKEKLFIFDRTFRVFLMRVLMYVMPSLADQEI